MFPPKISYRAVKNFQRSVCLFQPYHKTFDVAVTNGWLLFAIFINMIFKEVIKEPFEVSQSNKSDWNSPRTCVGVRVCVRVYMPVRAISLCTRASVCLKSMFAFSIHHKVNL